MATSEQIKYITEWKRQNIRVIKIECNKRADADVIARLDEVGNKAGYIKALIRADIARRTE